MRINKVTMTILLAVACLAFEARLQGDAVTYTFDTSTDLLTNFDIDVISGDGATQWQTGYNAGPPIEASDGGFVHLNSWDRANSLQFLSGPVFLNSFDISSNYNQSNSGTNQANTAGNDYRLVLYDSSFNPLYDEVLMVSSTGSWDEVTLNVDNVSVIWIDSRPTGPTGWWANLDNIRVNQIPEPGSLFVLSLTGCALVMRRRKRGPDAC